MTDDEGMTKGPDAPGKILADSLGFGLAIFDLRGGFADAQAHAHDTKDPVAFLEVAGRIQVARSGKIDIDDFLDSGGTIAHDEDAIGELDGFLDIVRDEEDRFLFALPNAHEIGAHFQAGEKVERAERFVHIDDLRIGGERASDLDALTHSAGKLVRVGVFKTSQTDHADIARDRLVALALSLFAQTEADVLMHVQPGKNAVLLKNENATRIGRDYGFSFDQDIAGSRLEKSGHDVEQCRFSAPARPDDANKLTVCNVGGDIFEDADGVAIFLPGEAH